MCVSGIVLGLVLTQEVRRQRRQANPMPAYLNEIPTMPVAV
jgi:hypothetical protein